MTDQFDLLKSYIDAYTRKDGAVVNAHDDKRVHHEGDSVKVTGNVNGQGKTGVIHETAPSGHFHIVKHSDGSKASYHESDLSPHDEDEDDERDEDDEGHEVLKSHIEAFTRKDGAVVQAHDDSRVPKPGEVGHEEHKQYGAYFKRGDKVKDNFGNTHEVMEHTGSSVKTYSGKDFHPTKLHRV